MTTANTIVLKSRTKHRLEYPADAILSPGHILMLMSDGGVQKYNLAGGRCERILAVEDVMQGKTISDAYASGDRVMAKSFDAGDEAVVRLAAAATAVVVGSRLQSDGAGGVKISAGLGTHSLAVATAVSTAVSNTTTPTTFSTGTYTLPASTLQVGDVLVLKGEGIATATNSTDTLAITVLVGSNTVLTIPALDVADNNIFDYEITLTVRSISTTTCTIVGEAQYSIGAAASTMKMVSVAAFTINSTIANVIATQATWSVASASNSVRLDVFDIEMSRTNPSAEIMVALEAVDNSAGSSDAFLAARWL